jgi:type I restriction enzyme S subunit
VQRGTIGKIVIIDREIGDATINPSMVILNAIKINSFFLYFQLCSFIGQRQIELLTSQTGVPMINQKQINSIKIAIPKNDTETNSIAIRIQSIDKIILNEQELLTKQQQIKAGLMNDLLSGKKKVKVKLETVTHE